MISKEYKELNKMGIIEKIFGTHSEHELKRIYPIVDHIDALEPEMQARRLYANFRTATIRQTELSA